MGLATQNVDHCLLGIDEIAFEVRDLERSIAFYRDILGLPLYSRGPQQAWFSIGTQLLRCLLMTGHGNVVHTRVGYLRLWRSPNAPDQLPGWSTASGVRP